jgi:hypothetical protein
MRVAILDDIHHAYEATGGVRRLRERADVKIFTEPFGDPSALRGFDALIANERELALLRIRDSARFRPCREAKGRPMAR